MIYTLILYDVFYSQNLEVTIYQRWHYAKFLKSTYVCRYDIKKSWWILKTGQKAHLELAISSVISPSTGSSCVSNKIKWMYKYVTENTDQPIVEHITHFSYYVYRRQAIHVQERRREKMIDG